MRTSAILIALKYLGYDVRLHDGSFENWSGRVDLPVIGPAVNDSRKKRP